MPKPVDIRVSAVSWGWESWFPNKGKLPALVMYLPYEDLIAISEIFRSTIKLGQPYSLWYYTFKGVLAKIVEKEEATLPLIQIKGRDL